MIRDQLLNQLYALEREGIKLGLEPTRRLLERCGKPHLAYPSIQIAGTNGKGSTAAMTAAILGRHGNKVGLYTSPHLINFNERIRVDGTPIPDDYLMSWMEQHAGDIEAESTTFFEATTVMALCYFRDQGVDWAVLETGLGGRLDSTTAAESTIGAFSPIALDHVDILGQTIEAIALEKAGIMNSGMVCYSSPQRPEAEAALARESARLGLQLTFVDESVVVPQPKYLAGKHQQQNGALAWVVADEALGGDFAPDVATLAIEQTVWPGRYQKVRAAPTVIYDVAHNPHGIAVVLDVLKEEKVTGKRWAVLALQQDKSAEVVAKMITGQFDTIMITQTDTRKYLPASEIEVSARLYHSNILVESDAKVALNKVLEMAEPDDLVAILGSHYLGPTVGEVFKISFDKL